MMQIPAEVVHPGMITAEALVTGDSLSFWGGIDPSTGIITDVHHELCGTSIAGKIFVFPRGAGSSSGCGVIMEMVRCGTNPAGIINLESEVILALGPIISLELYGRDFPMVTVKKEDLRRIKTGDILTIDTEKRSVTLNKS